MIKGSLVAIVTPMEQGNKPDNAIDYSAFEALIDWHIAEGTQGIVVAGTTGESATLSETEHCELIEYAVKYAKRRIPIIAGTGANSTSEAMVLTQFAKQAGADGCLLVTPYYNRPTQEGLYRHFKWIAEHVDIPQILYNVPSRTACDLLPETVARLAEIPNILGIKEASNDLNRVATLKKNCGASFVLLSGEDGSAKDFMLNGGDGVISVTSNVTPKAMRQLCDLATKKNQHKANVIDQSIASLHRDLFLESNPIPVKWCLHKMGKIQPGIRMPLTWMDTTQTTQLEKTLSGFLT